MMLTMSRYLTILNLLIATGIVYVAVGLFYKVTANRLETPPPVNPTPVKTKTALISTQPRKEYDVITKRDLFLTSKAATRASQQLAIDVDQLKQTELKLILWGTVTGPGGYAYAVIEDSEARLQGLYRINDMIQDATLSHIFREKVVLNVNGKNEVLAIEEFRLARKGAPSPTRTPPATAPSGSKVKSADGENIRIQQSKIEDAVQNVNQLMKQVRIRPHFTDGNPDGLRVTGIRPDSIFAEMGLKSGDIITGVDDQQIESLDDALKFYNSLKSGTSVKLQIRRKGSPSTIDYTIE
jgi:general secretion pathway protein C